MESRLSSRGWGFLAFGVCCVGVCGGRLGGWRSGLLCATRVRLIFADPGGRRTMVRRGVPLSMGSSVTLVWKGCSEVDRGFPARPGPPPTQPTRGFCVTGVVRYSIWVIAQQNPTSSRAAATAMIVRRLLRASSLVQVRCNRRCALHATATASAGWPACRSVSVLRTAGALRVEVRRRRGALAGPSPTPPSRTRRDHF